MKENIWYLFISGILLGSGPCLTLCAPVLISYSAALKSTVKKSLYSYLVFSLCKLIGYCTLGALCAIGVKILHSESFQQSFGLAYQILGVFIFIIGATILLKGKSMTGFCSWIHKGNIRNVGILGLLIGVSPCLPLLGILNYVIIIARAPSEAIFLTLIFGLGTIISPLPLAMMLSGKAASYLTKNSRLALIVRLLSGGIILLLGINIVLSKILN
jgi:Cytochrome C biogenesis protein transmembrane region